MRNFERLQERRSRLRDFTRLLHATTAKARELHPGDKEGQAMHVSHSLEISPEAALVLLGETRAN